MGFRMTIIMWRHMICIWCWTLPCRIRLSGRSSSCRNIRHPTMMPTARWKSLTKRLQISFWEEIIRLPQMSLSWAARPVPQRPQDTAWCSMHYRMTTSLTLRLSWVRHPRRVCIPEWLIYWMRLTNRGCILWQNPL